jgi:hypothetical protein
MHDLIEVLRDNSHAGVLVALGIVFFFLGLVLRRHLPAAETGRSQDFLAGGATVSAVTDMRVYDAKSAVPPSALNNQIALPFRPKINPSTP